MNHLMNTAFHSAGNDVVPLNFEEITILIVDDNITNLTVIVDYLEEYGFVILVSQDGQSGLERAKYARPDLILLDIMMPDIDGFEVCRQLKADPLTQDIPVIFMTALTNLESTINGFAVGAVDYITKPIQYQELLARIKTHLSLRHLQKQLQEANNVLEQRVATRTAQLKKRTVELEAKTKELILFNEACQSFVPNEFLRLLHKENIMDVRLGDQIKTEMTVLFSDIRDFTTLSESMSPQDNFNFLNAYLKKVSPIIRQNNGFIDKYIGDAIMALFAQHSDNALQSAIQMHHQVAEYNIHRQQKNYSPIRIGVGIHTGSMMLGIIGEQKRKQGTVISDAVNLASRLEGLTKKRNASIIISEETLNHLQDPSQYNYRFLGRIQVKGKRQAVSVFEVFDGGSDAEIELKLKTKADFEEGLALYYEKKFAESCVKFDTAYSENPQDKAAYLYLQRAASFMVEGVPADWTGVEVQ